MLFKKCNFMKKNLILWRFYIEKDIFMDFIL